MFMSHAFDSKVNVFGSKPSVVMTAEAGGWTLTGAGWPGGKQWFATRAQAHCAARELAEIGLRVVVKDSEPVCFQTSRFHLAEPRQPFGLDETVRRQVVRRRAG